MALDLRRAVARDAPAVAELWLRARRQAADLIPAPVHTDQEVRGWIASHVLVHLEGWVAEAGSGARIVGLLALENYWVDQLYVLPGCQGQGVGSALLDVAKRERPRGLQLWTFTTNTPARRFYEERGFVAVEETDGSGNEERAPDVRYVWNPARPGGADAETPPSAIS